MKNERNVEIELSKRRLVLIAIPFLIFSFLALAATFAQENIDATVAVAPIAHLDCVPDVLFVDSSVQWINCFITIDNGDVNDIDPSSVHLGVLSNSCNIPADLNNFIVQDTHRVFVRFSRNAADSSCFGPPTSTTDFTLVVSGLLNNLPFAPTDDLLYLKSCSEGHVHQLLANVSTNAGKINVLNTNSLSLDAYTPKRFSLNGFFDCRPSGRIIGDMKFFTSGTFKEEVELKLFSWKIKLFNRIRPVQISVVLETLDNCFGVPEPTSNKPTTATFMQCIGKGTLFIDKEQPFGRERISLNNLMIQINGTKATIKGGNIFNDKIDVDNLVVSKTNIKLSLPKI